MLFIVALSARQTNRNQQKTANYRDKYRWLRRGCRDRDRSRGKAVSADHLSSQCHDEDCFSHFFSVYILREARSRDNGKGNRSFLVAAKDFVET
jgi:hypothetical protein